MHSKYEIPISVETFAAYLDGVLPKEEMERMGKIIESDDILRAILDTSDSIDINVDVATVEQESLDIERLEIPNPEIESFEGIDDDDFTIIIENVETFLKDENSFVADEGDGLHTKGGSITTSETIKDIAMKDTKTFGYEPNYEFDTFDPNIYQGYNNTCAIRAQEIVLRDYGIMISQEELMEYAEQQGWFDSDPEKGGSDPETVGNILDACCVETVRSQDATIYDIIAELRAGHRVIVGVDSEELWLKKDPSLTNRLFGKVVNLVNDTVQDFIDKEGATHALIVAGVNVNPSDLSDIHVTLIDPGTGEMCVEYSFKEFEKAWEDSHHRMIATKSPAPYQYNYATHEMEPSGFSSDFIPSNIHLPETLTNTFHLSDAYYTTYEDYVELYSEEHHIPFKGSPHHSTMEVNDDDTDDGHEEDTESESKEIDDTQDTYEVDNHGDDDGDGDGDDQGDKEEDNDDVNSEDEGNDTTGNDDEFGFPVDDNNCFSSDDHYE